MSGVARLGDISSGHDGFNPRPLISGSTDSFINGIPISRIGDALAIHCDDDTCHTCNQSTGSSTVFVNGVPVARLGDATGCGDVIASASTDTFAG
jgi:uncharacterized Zn-binding protein involved in type VI secretion